MPTGNSIRVLPALLAAVAVLSSSSLADVIVVDAGGGGDFVTIQAAVDAAVDGDTILVKPGAYAGFTATNKALSIVGDTMSTVHVGGGVRVLNLSAGKAFLLQNVGSDGAFSADPLTVQPFAPAATCPIVKTVSPAVSSVSVTLFASSFETTIAMPTPQLKVRANSSGSIFPCAWRKAISRGCGQESASTKACSRSGRMRGMFSSSPPPVMCASAAILPARMTGRSDPT